MRKLILIVLFVGIGAYAFYQHQSTVGKKEAERKEIFQARVAALDVQAPSMQFYDALEITPPPGFQLTDITISGTRHLYCENSLLDIAVFKEDERLQPNAIPELPFAQRHKMPDAKFALDPRVEPDERFFAKVHSRTEESEKGWLEDIVEYHKRVGKYEVEAVIYTTFKGDNTSWVDKRRVLVEKMLLGAKLIGKLSPDGGETLPLTRPQLWALAASGMLTEKNGFRHDLLGEQESSAQNKEDEKLSLRKWWGITGKESLLDVLDSLDGHGYREDFEELGQKLSRLSDDQFAEQFKKITDRKAAMKLAVVREYYPKLGEKSLMGWDFARYISVCRKGYYCGFLSESEAWEKIMPAARKLQKTFTSWRELGENYLIGRQYWWPDEGEKQDTAFREVLTKLSESPESPWQRLPWDLDLSESTAPAATQRASARRN